MNLLRSFLILMLCIQRVFASPAEEFAAANDAYNQRDFPRAISGYESLVRHGETRPEIFHNLGLAYEQAAQPAKAIVNFERALLLAPSLPDAQSHLDRLVQGPKNWWEQIPRFGSRANTIAAAVGIWFLIIALVARWRVLGGTRNFWSALAALSLVGAVIAAANLFYRELPLASPNRAIVLKAEKLRANFTEASVTILPLSPGQPVEIRSVNGEWTNCALPDQTRGWVATSSLERVVPGT